MSKLEAWQRYRKATPCPICGGYGAYKPENRCKGFRTADGLGAWCSQVAPAADSLSRYFDALGQDLWYHPYSQEQGEGEVGKRTRAKSKKHKFAIAGSLRHQARMREAKRPPHPREFG